MPQDAAALRTTLSLAPVIPVIILDDVAKARPLAEALVAGGLPVLEVTPSWLGAWAGLLAGRSSGRRAGAAQPAIHGCQRAVIRGLHSSSRASATTRSLATSASFWAARPVTKSIDSISAWAHQAMHFFWRRPLENTPTTTR